MSKEEKKMTIEEIREITERMIKIFEEYRRGKKNEEVLEEMKKDKEKIKKMIRKSKHYR